MKMLKSIHYCLFVALLIILNGCQSSEEQIVPIAVAPAIESWDVEPFEAPTVSPYENGKPNRTAMGVTSGSLKVLVSSTKTSCDRYTLRLSIPSGGFADPKVNPSNFLDNRITAVAQLVDMNGNVLINYTDNQFVHSGSSMTGTILTAGIKVNATSSTNLQMRVTFIEVNKVTGAFVASSRQLFAIQFGTGSSIIIVQKTC